MSMPVNPAARSRARVVFPCLFSAIFLWAGFGLVREGIRAIRDRAYSLEYTEGLSWADGAAQGGSGAEHHAAEYRGREAVAFGIGFAAAGVMLLAWAAGLAAGLAARRFGRADRPMPRPAIFLIGGVSLAALAVACIAWFPPWQLHALPFHGVVATFILAVALPLPAAMRKKVFPAMVGLVILAGMTGLPAFPVFAGIVVFLVAGTHLLVLWPGLAARLDPDRRKPRPGPARRRSAPFLPG